MTTMDRFKEVVKDISVPPFDVTEETPLVELKLDVLDMVALVCDLEEEFKIAINDDVIDALMSDKSTQLGALVRLIDESLAEQKGQA